MGLISVLVGRSKPSPCSQGLQSFYCKDSNPSLQGLQSSAARTGRGGVRLVSEDTARWCAQPDAILCLRQAQVCGAGNGQYAQEDAEALHGRLQ